MVIQLGGYFERVPALLDTLLSGSTYGLGDQFGCFGTCFGSCETSFRKDSHIRLLEMGIAGRNVLLLNLVGLVGQYHTLTRFSIGFSWFSWTVVQIG